MAKWGQFDNKVPQHIELMGVIRQDFKKHPFENLSDLPHLRRGQFKKVFPFELENRVIPDTAETFKKVAIENTVNSASEIFGMLPFIWYLWIGKR